MKRHSKLLSLACLLLVLLFAATALTGCKNTTAPSEQLPENELPSIQADASTSPASGGNLTPTQFVDTGKDDAQTPADEIRFTLEVTLTDGTQRTHEITTSCATVGEALLQEGLIDGEDSQYGLYVTTVDGATLDWDADQMYWAFYIDGEYAMTGVDATPIEEGATYALVATEG